MNTILTLQDALRQKVYTAPRSPAYQVTLHNDKYAMTGWDDPCEMQDLAEILVFGFLTSPDDLFTPHLYSAPRRLEKHYVKTSFLVAEADDPNAIPFAAFTAQFNNVHGFCYTTKNHNRDKNGVTCERYRAVLATSRPMNMDEWSTLQILFGKAFGTDEACKDASRCFAGSTPSRILIHLQGNEALDVDAYLRIAKQFGIESHHLAQAHGSTSTNAVVPLAAGTVDKNLLARIIKYHKTLDAKRHTHSRMYSCMKKAFHFCRNASTVESTMLSWDVCADWLSRHPNQKSDFTKQIEKAWRDFSADLLSDYHVDIATANPVEDITSGTLPELRPAFRSAMDKHSLTNAYTITPLMWDTARLVQHLLERPTKHIMKVVCGGGKSVGATCYVASQASDSNRFWIVRESVLNCMETCDTLTALGVARVGVLSGYKGEICTQISGNQNPSMDWRTMYGKHSPCKSCKQNSLCPFYQTHWYEKEVRKSSHVLIMPVAR